MQRATDQIIPIKK